MGKRWDACTATLVSESSPCHMPPRDTGAQVHTKADLTRDGVPEVVIAREGGDLEIYSRDDMGQMEHIAKHNVGSVEM